MKDLTFSERQVTAAKDAISVFLCDLSDTLVTAYLMGLGGQTEDWLDGEIAYAEENSPPAKDETATLTRVASKAMSQAAFSMGVQDLHHTIAGEDNLS